MKILPKMGGVKPSLPLFIFMFILFVGAVWVYPNGIEARTQRGNNLSFALLIVIAIYIMMKINVWIGALMSYTIFSLLIHRIVPIDIIENLTTYSVMFIGLVFLYPKVRDHKDSIYDLIILIALLNILWQVLQMYGTHWIVYPIHPSSHYPGLMSNQNETTALYALTVPVCFRKNRWLLIVILVFGMILSKSLNGVLVTSIISTIYFYKKLIHNRNSKFGIIFVSIIVSFLMFFYNIDDHRGGVSSISDRADAWTQASKVAIEKPLGWGLTQFRVVFPLITSPTIFTEKDMSILKYYIDDPVGVEKLKSKINRNYWPPWAQAHNEYLEFWFEVGLVGLFFLLIAITNILKKARGDDILFYSFLSSCLLSVSFFTWHIVPLTVITFFYIVLIQGEYLYVKENN